MAAIERQHHAMHLELALAAHRDLGDGGRVAAVAHELRDAAMHAGRKRLAPVALLGRGVEHGEMLGMLPHERAAKLERVLARRARHLVDEAFHVDGVLVGIDAAPRADRHVGVAHGVFDQQVGHAVAELGVARLRPQPLQLAHVPAAGNRRLVQGGVDRLSGHAHVQPAELAVGVETGGQRALRDRAVEVVRLVFFATPDQFDRNVRELLGDRHRLVHDNPACRRAGQNRRRGRSGEHRICRAATPEASDSAASEASTFWLGTQASALSAEILTVAFIGSMVAWARNGVL